MTMHQVTPSTLVRLSVRGLLLAACIVSLATQSFLPGTASAATTLPILWSAGGLDAGSTGAGQAARIAADASGNIAVVSGPSNYRDLAVTSYTASGVFRWRSSVSPSSGTFHGDWVVAAPGGDFIAIGRNVNSQGNPIGNTMVRYATDGTLKWRKDFSASFYPAIGRLIVDSGGNAYLAWNAVGGGLFVQKYSPSGDLLWSQTDPIGGGYGIATSLALSPDEADVVASGDVSGGAIWLTSLFDAATGVRKWGVAAAEGTAARDVLIDATRVYVTGQGVTNPGTPSMAYHLTVVAYDRATGARLWRTDKKPADGTSAAGLRMALAPDGSFVVTGQAARGFLDWYTVAFETTGAVRWEAVRDGGLNTDEIPQAVLVLPDGVTVVTGPGGPNLPGGYIQGVTAGYSSTGALLWEAFARMATVWVTALPNSDVCATGGYDALVTCWRPSGGVVSTPTPIPGPSNTPTNTPVVPTPTNTPGLPTPTNTPAASVSTGFLSPSANAPQTSGAGDNNGYQANPANAYANDSSAATDTDSGTNTSTSCTDNGKDKHSYYNYNFNLPAAAVIRGIQVRLDGRADATNGSPKICAQLSWDGGATWTTAKATSTLTRTEATYTLGSTSDTWGRAWSADSFGNASFRVRVTDVASNPGRDFFLDYVAVNVTYQP